MRWWMFQSELYFVRPFGSDTRRTERARPISSNNLIYWQNKLGFIETIAGCYSRIIYSTPSLENVGWQSRRMFRRSCQPETCFLTLPFWNINIEDSTHYHFYYHYPFLIWLKILLTWLDSIVWLFTDLSLNHKTRVTMHVWSRVCGDARLLTLKLIPGISRNRKVDRQRL